MSYTVAKGNQRVDPDQVPEAGKIPEGVVDLRSDTVTRPTAEMRRAMAEAEVGDDVYGEDPTVTRLEKRAAEMFGKEAPLFVPTGCMGNLIAIKEWTHHGNEVICEERSDGKRALVCRENKNNMAGGTVYPTTLVEDSCEHAHAAGLKVHLDGAGIFNAATALGDTVANMTRKVDSVMFCLSKGLGAPVGSMIAGTKAFIEKGRVCRKMFAGGMRQAGVIAAAGLIALA